MMVNSSEGSVESKSSLTQQEAAARSNGISEVHYTVELDLTAGAREFRTSTAAEFRVHGGDVPTFLDFCGQVESVMCNGEELGSDPHDGTRVWLNVRAGKNTVRVTGYAPYSTAGEGLHRFCDPLDGQAYVHTKFQPFAAHRAYACFDQPDLKATFDLTVTTDAAYSVVANTEPSEDPASTAVTSTWNFKTTPPLPPYLLGFAVGPFQHLRSTHRGVPLALYVRESLFDDLACDAQELFDVIGHGLDFYSRLFRLPYPFTKYDHVFAPEYAFGGMEHPGCVTINERLVFRNRVTEEARRRRAELLLHEMAHMWFGNFVTMRWWDDLWLNEGFATMMAVVAQPKVTRYGEGWTAFAHHVLPVARRADQLPTSHPVSVETVDASAARANFGPIVYKKGAAVLHELAVRIGWESFVEGVRTYLGRHAWGSAGLADFAGALQEVSGENVDRWMDEWLLSPGVNTVEVSRVEGGDWLLQLPEHQVPPRHLQLRVGAFDDADEELALRKRKHVQLSPSRCEEELCEFDGHSPELLVPNDDALSHVKVRLDPVSRRTALRRLSALDDRRVRAVVWGALWDEVLDARLPARTFASTAFTHGLAEGDVGVLEVLLDRAVQAVQVYGDPSNTNWILASLARRVRDHLAGAAPGGDRQVVLARTFTAVAQADDQDVLAEMVCGRFPWSGLEIGRDLRWRGLLRLATTGCEIDELLGIVRQTDPGDNGRRNALTVEAARPTHVAKEQAWDRVFNDAYSLAEQQAIMAGLRQPGQEDLLTPYAERYMCELETRAGVDEPEFVRAFARALYPRFTHVEARIKAYTDDLLAKKNLPAHVLKVLAEERAELETMQTARACDASKTTHGCC